MGPRIPCDEGMSHIASNAVLYLQMTSVGSYHVRDGEEGNEKRKERMITINCNSSNISRSRITLAAVVCPHDYHKGNEGPSNQGLLI